MLVPNIAEGLVDEEEVLSCTDCGARFAVRDGIYDFKTPLEGGAG